MQNGGEYIDLFSKKNGVRPIKSRTPFSDRKCLLHVGKTLLELINASACINKLLLAGEEGMALGTNFHADILLGGAGLDHVTAGTGDGGLLVVGMDALLHSCHLFRIFVD